MILNKLMVQCLEDLTQGKDQTCFLQRETLQPEENKVAGGKKLGLAGFAQFDFFFFLI